MTPTPDNPWTVLRRVQIPSGKVGGIVVSGHNAKCVLRQIADYGDGCWPSLATIARDVQLGRATVKRAVRWLGELGLIRVVTGGGGRSSSVYHLCWAAIESNAERVQSGPSRGVTADRLDRAEGPERTGGGSTVDRETVRCGASEGPERTPKPKEKPKEKEKVKPAGAREATDPASVFPVEQPTDEQTARLVALVQQVEAAWPMRDPKRRLGARDLQAVLKSRLYDFGLPDWDAPAVAALEYAKSPLGQGRFGQRLGNWVRDRGWLEDPASWEDDGEHEKRNGRQKSEEERIEELNRALAEADARDAELMR